jgi:hypothetical protein
MPFHQHRLMSTTNNVESLKIIYECTILQCDIGNRKWVSFINFDKSLFSMFRLRSEQTEHRVESLVLELIRLEQLVHVFEHFNLEFGLVGMVGPFFELSSHNYMHSLPFWGVQKLLNKFL